MSLYIGWTESRKTTEKTYMLESIRDDIFIKPISYKSQIFSLSTQRCVLFLYPFFKEVRNIKSKTYERICRKIQTEENDRTTAIHHRRYTKS